MAPKINLILLLLACTAGCACARLGEHSSGPGAPRALWGEVAKVFKCKNDGNPFSACANDCGCKGRCVLAQCTEGKQGHFCSDKSHCDTGNCIRFRCADGAEGSTCDVNAQCYAGGCKGGNCFCNAGKCKARLPTGHGCNDGSQCSSGSCVRFKCADGDMGSTCDNNSQCHTNKCANGKCWCDVGQCKARLPTGHGCNDGSQCSTGNCIRFQCADGSAGSTCDNNAQCYAEKNMFCEAGKCTNPKEQYNFRKAKPECVADVKAQGGCGSCWAFAAATAASQRLCLGEKTLSPTHLQCEILPAEDKDMCDGHYAGPGMNLIADKGGIALSDFPYPSDSAAMTESICTDPSWGVGGNNRAGAAHTTLVAGTHYYKDAYVQDPKKPFRDMDWNEPLFREKVKYELLTYGPVPVSLNVRNDFKNFRADPACWAAGGGKPFSRKEGKSCCRAHHLGDGVDYPWRTGSKPAMYAKDPEWCDHYESWSDKESKEVDEAHAMVIVGYGTFEGEDYWEVENSWGSMEMLGGTMRVAMDYAKKGDKEWDAYVTTSLPKSWTP